MAREIEAKIALAADELSTVRERLIALGASRGPVDDELNVVFDLKPAGRRFRRHSLRLRTYRDRPGALLTCKGPVDRDSTYKSRDEVEVRVADVDSARELLEQLGFRPKAQYDKRREHWFFRDVVVTLDRLAFGDFLEVEGNEQSIASTLSLLGMDQREHIPAGYARLSRECSKASPKDFEMKHDRMFTVALSS